MLGELYSLYTDILYSTKAHVFCERRLYVLYVTGFCQNENSPYHSLSSFRKLMKCSQS